MGIGLPRDQRVRAAYHVGCHVGVEVQRPNDRHRGADHLTHGGDQVALHVVNVLGHRGPVKRQQHAVHGQAVSQPIQEIVLELRVTRRCDHATRTGARVEERHGLGASSGQHTEHATDHARIDRQDLITPTELVALEPAPVDQGASELVAFGQDRPDGDSVSAHASSSRVEGKRHIDENSSRKKWRSRQVITILGHRSASGPRPAPSMPRLLEAPPLVSFVLEACPGRNQDDTQLVDWPRQGCIPW